VSGDDGANTWAKQTLALAIARGAVPSTPPIEVIETVAAVARRLRKRLRMHVEVAK
jgi:hypothetical protein